MGGSLIQASSLAKRPRKNHLFGGAAGVLPEPGSPPVPGFRSIPADGDHRPGTFVRAATVDLV